jgi:hypothetical protein
LNAFLDFYFKCLLILHRSSRVENKHYSEDTLKRFVTSAPDYFSRHVLMERNMESSQGMNRATLPAKGPQSFMALEKERVA